MTTLLLVTGHMSLVTSSIMCCTFFSMKITEDEAIQAGLEQKAKEFVEKGSELYVP